MAPEVSVIGKTQARVMSSQRETASTRRPGARLPLSTTWRQLSRRPANPGTATAGRSATASAGFGMADL